MALSLTSLVFGFYVLNFTLAFIILNKDIETTRGMLYPRESETREVRSLDGIWNFVRSDVTNPTQGIRDGWFKDDLSRSMPTIPMPVPASYNDITTEQALRDHVGTVWYDRKFFVPRSWAKDQRVWLRFGSVHYEAFVWINGQSAVKHEIGHLPFETEVTHLLKYGGENRITVMCDNALIQTTVPQGKISEVANDDGVTIIQSYTFDFFNYAGIHRSVHLYTTPKTFIEEVDIKTNLTNNNSVGYVDYSIIVNGSAANEADNTLYARLQLYNREGNLVANATSDSRLLGSLKVDNVNPWWPYLMHSDPGYLYEMEIKLYAAKEQLLDVYRLSIGIRTLTWSNTSFLINGKPIYFRGFGRHEDSDIRGKGLDNALMTRDFNLLKWIGANAYRTSHYPYSEESMQFADRYGIMIIDECPSVDTENFNQALLLKHKSSLEQLVHRDRNHPSVVMWSIANEPRTGQLNADTYFQFVANYTRSLDSTRPITAAIAVPSTDDKAGRYLDIISFNRYNAWYSNTGRLDMVTKRVIDEATAWNKKYDKPVLMAEYGADTLEGLHLQPAYVWSEEFQTEVFSRHFKAFDALRRKKWFIGEFVWNFADFKTAQSYTRVGGNKKGVFTRSRQPKASAHLLRQRYFALGREMDQCSLPSDLFTYIADAVATLSLTSLVFGFYVLNFTLAFIILNKDIETTRGMLYPRESETREVRSLDGIWNFVRSDVTNPTQGIRDGWFKDDLSRSMPTIPMPVPASYNDITTEQALRDHVGTVWYDRKFFVPRSWAKDQRVWLRFGSVHYEAFVWINGQSAVKHEIGHLPFETEVTHLLKYGGENRITVMCDNALIQTTVPQGKISEVANDDGVTIIQSYTFDFFNYAGIHRSVHLYTTPKTFIEEVDIKTNLTNNNSVGYVDYSIIVNGSAANEADNTLYARLQLYNREGNLVANATSDSRLLGSLKVDNVNPWWPYLMHSDPGYLYEMEIKLYAAKEQLLDVYRLSIGIRTLTWSNTSFLINGKPIYFRGFGRHEDSDIRGKGLDNALMTRDFNLLKWIGANAYRTSHYPYSEESMQFADRYGIMIIDECPSVDTENFNQALLLKHKSSLEQLVHRDRNHPSVVMWSIANEPRTGQLNADTYFQFVANYTRSLDSTRPITAAIAVPSTDDKAGRYLDIISFNRYNAWYSNTGRLDMVTKRVIDEATAWNKKYDKPVLMAEYGADTLEGLHLQPAYVWSEEFQTEVFSRHFKAFDALRRKKWFIGEFVWNFADFKTAQSYTRVGGNKKGVFTRSRQPKASAHLLRQRYFALGREMDQCSLPSDLFTYIADAVASKHDSSDL